ncbi:hypothetical protein G9P44_001816 [Scheffersomyces stipitis]|nr:hypothetical protein G9P44_001816 [Scheffersomyces stipitis]
MSSPPPGSLQDLANDLDSIYNTYAVRSTNDSVDTLDSESNQVGAQRPYGSHDLPAVHISSRLSSLQLEDNNVVRSAPETPNSGSEFDFTLRSANINLPSHRALTNSSLNVLLDTPSTESDFKSLLRTQSGPDRDSDGIQYSQDSRDNGNDNDNENENVIYNDENNENWEARGAAVKKVPDGNSFKVIRRTVSDFKFGKEIGEGSYSTVMLATDKHTSKKYAVKVLDKRHIIKEKKVKYVNIEKHALNRLSNRMGIISLYFTFQDKSSLYFVLDYASNGELLSLIKKYNTLNEDCTRHFGAQILDAIKYMHDNGVIHRDIKPENILLDDKLRIQITDFGTARLLEKKNDETEGYPVDVRAKSFVGTAEYVSPELLESKYCGKPGDIWAFGCIIYQMIAGKPPFKATNEYLTFQKITKLQYAFSAGFPTIIRDLIKQILVLQPNKRANIAQIQKHYFFSSIDFNDEEQIWSKEPPEIGPYKMNAKAMMKVPELTSAVSSPAVPRRVVKKPGTTNGSSPTVDAMPTPKRIFSEGAVTKNVNPASVAAFVLSKVDTNVSNGVDDNDLEATKSRTNTSSAPSRTPSTPDYIPGTNILRPQIAPRTNYSKSLTQRKPAKSKTKSNVMEVTPLGTLEVAWGAYLKHSDERILRIGPVICHRETTETFERKHKGSLHNAPLSLSTKLQVTNKSRSNTSLLSQVVNGSGGLRSSLTADDDSSPKDESTAIIEYSDIEEAPESGLSRSDSTNSSSGTSKYSRSSFLRKLGLSHMDKNKDTSTRDDTLSVSTSSRHHSLDKSRTCTMIITTHGRALIFYRNDKENNYKLISEIILGFPFIQFKELVSASSKFQKMLPTTGIFTVTSVDTTLVFEVEKFEVNNWTEALAKSKLNQFEREREIAQQEQAPSTSKPSSPRLLDSPILTGNHLQSHRRSPSQLDYSKPKSDVVSSPSTPPTPTMRVVSDPKSNQKQMSKARTKRKPPPPLTTTGGLNMHTGLPSSSSDNGMLHAAQLAVSNNANNPVTNNRRSSFTKDDVERHSSPGPRRSNGKKQQITSMNSKLLARSQRKK